jgi:hypothetical protein
LLFPILFQPKDGRLDGRQRFARQCRQQPPSEQRPANNARTASSSTPFVSSRWAREGLECRSDALSDTSRVRYTSIDPNASSFAERCNPPAKRSANSRYENAPRSAEAVAREIHVFRDRDDRAPMQITRRVMFPAKTGQREADLRAIRKCTGGGE